MSEYQSFKRSRDPSKPSIDGQITSAGLISPDDLIDLTLRFFQLKADDKLMCKLLDAIGENSEFVHKLISEDPLETRLSVICVLLVGKLLDGLEEPIKSLVKKDEYSKAAYSSFWMDGLAAGLALAKGIPNLEGEKE